MNKFKYIYIAMKPKKMKSSTKKITLKLLTFLSFLIATISCSSSNSELYDLNFQSDYQSTPNNSTLLNPIQENTSQENEENNTEEAENETNSSKKYLALGDSYTIGTSVCETCSYPIQLKNVLEKELNITANTKIIAQSGWTTSVLQNAINNENLSNEYDLVTLLIGVNNQYQNRSFDIYEKEFPELLDQAIKFAKGNPENVIVISIPDYAFTPFGQNTSNPEKISSEIDNYNAFSKQISNQKSVKFIDITDITREGLNDPDLVASDDLHPSEKAYTKFIERLFPICTEILN